MKLFFQASDIYFCHFIGESKHLGLWIKRQKRQYTRYIERAQSFKHIMCFFRYCRTVLLASPSFSNKIKLIFSLFVVCFYFFSYFLFLLCNHERGLLRAERVVRLQQLVDQGLLSWSFPEPYKKGINNILKNLRPTGTICCFILDRSAVFYFSVL